MTKSAKYRLCDKGGAVAINQIVGEYITLKVGAIEAKRVTVNEMRRKIAREVDMVCLNCPQHKEQLHEMPERQSMDMRVRLSIRCNGRVEMPGPGDWTYERAATGIPLVTKAQPMIYQACPDGYMTQGNYVPGMKLEPAPEPRYRVAIQATYRDSMPPPPPIPPVPLRNKDRPQVEGVDFW